MIVELFLLVFLDYFNRVKVVEDFGIVLNWFGYRELSIVGFMCFVMIKFFVILEIFGVNDIGVRFFLIFLLIGLVLSKGVMFVNF